MDSSNVSIAQAVAIQRQLADQVVRTTVASANPRWIAGVDVSSTRYSRTLFCGVVVWDLSTRSIVEVADRVVQTQFPYVPGLLSFREAPGIIEAVRALRRAPDVILVDGQGLAHPRRLGLACHLGIVLDLPTVGCAKSRLIGTAKSPGNLRGASRALMDRSEIIGRVVRTRTGVAPVYVSIGHKVSLEFATRLVLRTAWRFRLPEPVREAHRHVNECRRRTQLGGSE